MIRGFEDKTRDQDTGTGDPVTQTRFKDLKEDSLKK